MFLVCVCVCVLARAHVCPQVYRYPQRPERPWNSLELNLQEVVTYLLWVLETGLEE